MAIKYFAVAAVLAAAAFAQGNLGGFTGTAIDTARASVPDAKLTLTSSQTNSVYSAVSDAGGVYTVRGVPPGTYRLEVEKHAQREDRATCRIQGILFANERDQ